MSIIRKYIMLTLLLVVDIGADKTESNSSLNDEVRCYFITEPKSGSWDEAMKVCSSSNSSLPIILNKIEQEALSLYLRNQSIITLVWTAGKQEEKSNWTWINEQNLINKEVIETPSNTSGYLTAAVLTQDLTYKAQDPQHLAYYFCQFEAKGKVYNGVLETIISIPKWFLRKAKQLFKPGDTTLTKDTSCDQQNNEFIKINSGCLSLTSSNKSSWYEALNDCLERGGHLPVLDNNDLNKLNDSRIWKANIHSIWLGLIKISWSWFSSNKNGMTHVDLPERNDGHCIAFSTSDGKFIPANCTNDLQFVCEERGCTNGSSSSDSNTAQSSSMSANMPTQTSCQYSSSTIKSMTNSQSVTSSASATQQGSGIIVAVVVGVICIIIIVVIAIMVTRRKSSQKNTENPESMARVEVTANKEDASAKQQGSNNGVYVEIPLATKSSTENACLENTHPGIVYASVDFENAPNNSNQAPANKTYPSSPENAYSLATHPGIVYASVDFENAPKNLNQAPVNKDYPQGSVYAEVIKSESESK